MLLLVVLPTSALNYKSSYLQGDDLHAEAMVYDIQSFPKQLQHVLPDIEWQYVNKKIKAPLILVLNEFILGWQQ